MVKKFLSLALVSVLTLSTLVGCTGGNSAGDNNSSENNSGDNNSGDNATVTSAPSTSTDSFPAEINISFWEGGTEQEVENGLTQVIEAYQKVRPEVKVNLISQPSDGYGQWLNTRYASNGMPEIVMSQPTLLRDAFEQGFLLNIENEFNNPNEYAGGKVWKDTFVKGSLNNVHDDLYNPTYAIPLQGLGLAYYYNKSTYDQLGLKVPQTYNEFIENCKVIENNNINPIALPAMKKDAVSWMIWYYTTGLFGNKYLSDHAININKDKTIQNNEHVKAIEEGLFDITEGDTKKDFEKYLDYIEELAKYAQKSTGLDEAGAKAQFLSGKAAHLMSGSWDLKAFVFDNETGIEIGAFPLPEFTSENSEYAGAQLTIASYTPLAITKTAARDENVKKATIDFMKFLTAPDNYKLFVETAACIPSVNDLNVDDSFKAFTTGNQPLLPIFARSSGTSPVDITYATIQVLSGEKYNRDEMIKDVQSSFVDYSVAFKEKLEIDKENNYKIDELPIVGGEFVPLKPTK